MWFKKTLLLWREIRQIKHLDEIWTSEQPLPASLWKCQTCRTAALCVILYLVLGRAAVLSKWQFCRRDCHLVLMFLTTCKFLWLQCLLPIMLFRLYGSSSNVRGGNVYIVPYPVVLNSVFYMPGLSDPPHLQRIVPVSFAIAWKWLKCALCTTFRVMLKILGIIIKLTVLGATSFVVTVVCFYQWSCWPSVFSYKAQFLINKSLALSDSLLSESILYMSFCCTFMSDFWVKFFTQSFQLVEVKLKRMFSSILADYGLHYENISGNADWMSLTVISLNWFMYLAGSLKIWLDDFVTCRLKSLWNFYLLTSKTSSQWLGPQ